ncbi:hypothetical protein CAEBREN_15254 [Caenorhabditis brenneri]|uniref:Serpentine receptor class gamma n=1 Tax=Caenorhabditis brenneri TaxID=135651 RepID=G0P029_CAEBE|nr:hypothetical protein CAEBREN_15254 [Caenorhabditis brenneri]
MSNNSDIDPIPIKCDGTYNSEFETLKFLAQFVYILPGIILNLAILQTVWFKNSKVYMNNSFFVIFSVDCVANTLILLSEGLAARFFIYVTPICPIVADYFANPLLVFKFMMILIFHSKICKSIIQALLVLNRMTCVLSPISHDSIWSKTILKIVVPLIFIIPICVDWNLAISRVFMRSTYGGLWVDYIKKVPWASQSRFQLVFILTAMTITFVCTLVTLVTLMKLPDRAKNLERAISNATVIISIGFSGTAAFQTVWLKHSKVYMENSFFVIFSVDCVVNTLILLTEGLMARPLLYIPPICPMIAGYFDMPMLTLKIIAILVFHAKICKSIIQALLVLYRMTCVLFPMRHALIWSKNTMKILVPLILLIPISVDWNIAISRVYVQGAYGGLWISYIKKISWASQSRFINVYDSHDNWHIGDIGDADEAPGEGQEFGESNIKCHYHLVNWVQWDRGVSVITLIINLLAAYKERKNSRILMDIAGMKKSVVQQKREWNFIKQTCFQGLSIFLGQFAYYVIAPIIGDSSQVALFVLATLWAFMLAMEGGIILASNREIRVVFKKSELKISKSYFEFFFSASSSIFVIGSRRSSTR